MLGVATLTLGSSVAMLIQTQTQHATTSASAATGKPLTIPCSRSRRNYYNGTESLPVGLVSSGGNSNFCSLFCSSKKSPPVKPSFTTAVAAVDSDQLSSSDPLGKIETKKYYFVVANAKFMLDEEEHFQEQLFERRRYYGERNKEHDFWLVIEPKFLDRFPNITNAIEETCCRSGFN
ncbi:Ycf54-like protein [Quillaja saponaria]|uniref:Ycf54-like protein n=1 Tax=Quillaja saponaria TaxID=32244 RepID=A0AAD7LKR9_QUISA|nr:Ycf54-like protein [Quillaja saponaria]